MSLFLKTLSACLDFARVRVGNFFRGYFSVVKGMIAGYLTRENWEKSGRK